MLFLVVAAFAISSAYALPWNWQHGEGPSRYTPSGGTSGQTPFKFPLPNGFPNIQAPSSALTAIEQQAHGTLPNSPLPTSLADASATTFQAIAFGEFFEVAFFSALLNNITNNVAGYEIGSGAVRELAINALTAIQAQEELHALGVNGILQSAGRTPVQPCEYIFPVNDFDSAIAAAVAFTDTVVLGGLQDALGTFSTDGDAEVVPLLTSVVGQEGEQNGFFRSILSKVPSALPFLTRSTGPFAYSYINQNFIVPRSCPTPITIPIFPALVVETPCIDPKDQQIQFRFARNDTATPNENDLHLVYINQQNLPIVQPIQGLQVNSEYVTFTASFPYTENLMNGLTLALVTNSAGPFSSADAVANATLYGPGVIEIN